MDSSTLKRELQAMLDTMDRPHSSHQRQSSSSRPVTPKPPSSTNKPDRNFPRTKSAEYRKYSTSHNELRNKGKEASDSKTGELDPSSESLPLGVSAKSMGSKSENRLSDGRGEPMNVSDERNKSSHAVNISEASLQSRKRQLDPISRNTASSTSTSVTLSTDTATASPMLSSERLIALNTAKSLSQDNFYATASPRRRNSHHTSLDKHSKQLVSRSNPTLVGSGSVSKAVSSASIADGNTSELADDSYNHRLHSGDPLSFADAPLEAAKTNSVPTDLGNLEERDYMSDECLDKVLSLKDVSPHVTNHSHKHWHTSFVPPNQRELEIIADLEKKLDAQLKSDPNLNLIASSDSLAQRQSVASKSEKTPLSEVIKNASARMEMLKNEERSGRVRPLEDARHHSKPGSKESERRPVPYKPLDTLIKKPTEQEEQKTELQKETNIFWGCLPCLPRKQKPKPSQKVHPHSPSSQRSSAKSQHRRK